MIDLTFSPHVEIRFTEKLRGFELFHFRDIHFLCKSYGKSAPYVRFNNMCGKVKEN